MKKTKIALTLVCAVLLVAASVMGTLAYLTSTTETVTNTFTVGNVKFDGKGLDEADVDQYGNLLYVDTDKTTLKDRVITNEYKLVPGHTYVKDPTVHIAANNEDCWLFVKVVNPISDIEADDPKEGTATTIAGQMRANGWVAVDATSYPGVYAYSSKISSSTSVQNIVVFESFTLKDDATFAESYSPITVQAALVQADGFTSYIDAGNANDELFTTVTPNPEPAE